MSRMIGRSSLKWQYSLVICSHNLERCTERHSLLYIQDQGLLINAGIVQHARKIKGASEAGWPVEMSPSSNGVNVYLGRTS